MYNLYGVPVGSPDLMLSLCKFLVFPCTVKPKPDLRGLEVWDLGLRVQGSESRVQG